MYCIINKAAVYAMISELLFGRFFFLLTKTIFKNQKLLHCSWLEDFCVS